VETGGLGQDRAGVAGGRHPFAEKQIRPQRKRSQEMAPVSVESMGPQAGSAGSRRSLSEQAADCAAAVAVETSALVTAACGSTALLVQLARNTVTSSHRVMFAILIYFSFVLQRFFYLWALLRRKHAGRSGRIEQGVNPYSAGKILG
jgi:hypothetical protein